MTLFETWQPFDLCHNSHGCSGDYWWISSLHPKVPTKTAGTHGPMTPTWVKLNLHLDSFFGASSELAELFLWNIHFLLGLPCPHDLPSYLFVFQDHHLGTVSLTNMGSYTLKPQIFFGISTSFLQWEFYTRNNPKKHSPSCDFLSPLGKFIYPPIFFFFSDLWLMSQKSSHKSHQLPSIHPNNFSKVGL